MWICLLIGGARRWRRNGRRTVSVSAPRIIFLKENLSRLCPAIARRTEKIQRFRNKQKQTETDLKESENKYRLSFDNVTDVVYVIDENFNVSSVSPSVERLLGYKPEDFVGKSVSNLSNILTPESLEQAMVDISFVLKGETISATIYRFIAKDGTIKYGEVSGAPLIREGKIIGIISVARDITERNRGGGSAAGEGIYAANHHR